MTERHAQKARTQAACCAERGGLRLLIPDEDLAQVACELPVNVLLCACQLHEHYNVTSCRHIEPSLQGLLEQAYGPTCRFMYASTDTR